MASELANWLEAAGRIPRITRAQEILLARDVQAYKALPEPAARTSQQQRTARRGLRAQQRLATANLRLVAHIVLKRWAGQVPDHQLLDLLQAGAEGAHHAAGKFLPTAGVAFSTYCAFWVVERVQREMMTLGHQIRVRGATGKKIRRLPRVRAELTQQLGREPSTGELAVALKLALAEVELAMTRLQTPLSLEAHPAGQEGGDTWGELLAAPAPRGEDTPEGWEALSELERRALRAQFGIGEVGIAEVAEREGLERRAVTQLAKRGLAKLRAEAGR